MDTTKLDCVVLESVERLLHPRIATHCLLRYRDGYYKDAAAEAMTQVERAIKEKAGTSGTPKLCGVTLVKNVFGGSGIKLRVPFGPHMQEPAQKFLEGAFSYYRNYAVHEGEGINELGCLRILVVASDLLDLVGATTRSFADIGGVSGLISTGIFVAEKQVHGILSFLDKNVLPEETCDGFYENLYDKGFTEGQLKAMIDFGLVEYHVEPVNDPENDTDSVGVFTLTPLGRNVWSDLTPSP
ncbi:MAG TPA: TIGR02391 family protein [Candidatus Solibacter sp.]|jgi:uncharacterized protein (TIGR02391 family)|nr:TIGR02391 family protein [Candidatus Solibacter sp.]